MRGGSESVLLFMLLACSATPASASDPAQELLAPIAEGAALPGGYRVRSLGPSTSREINTTIEGPDGAVHVRFVSSELERPHYARTDHCLVYYTAENTAEAPDALGAALDHLVETARGQDDPCADLKLVRTTARGLGTPSKPWGAILAVSLFLAVLCGLPCWKRASRRQKEGLFYAGLVAGTAVGAWIRFQGIDGPFCESGSTQRIQLGASPLWQLLTMSAHDYRHPPMTFVVLHLTLWIGKGEALLRTPFVLATVAALPALGLVARRLSGRLAGVAICLVWAVTPALERGGEVSSHTLFFLAAPLVLLAHLHLRRYPSRAAAACLAFATAAALWTHFFAPVFLVLQLLDLLVLLVRRDGAPESRAVARILAGAVGAAVVAGALPLFYLLDGAARDVGIDRVAQGNPEALWGAAPAWQVLIESLENLDPILVGMVTVFALPGLILFVVAAVRDDDAEQQVGLWIATVALIIPAGVLAVTPWLRTRGFYITLAFPFLLVAAIHGVRRGGVLLARLVRTRPLLASPVSALAVAFLVSCSAAFTWQETGFVARDEGSSCTTDRIAAAIAADGTPDIALVHNYSQTLLGYYLADEVVPRAVADPGDGVFHYGPFAFHTLAPIDDLQEGWMGRAEERLAEMVRSAGAVQLVDFRWSEPSWDGLEQAGGCELVEEYPEARLLICRLTGDAGEIP